MLRLFTEFWPASPLNKVESLQLTKTIYSLTFYAALPFATILMAVGNDMVFTTHN